METVNGGLAPPNYERSDSILTAKGPIYPISGVGKLEEICVTYLSLRLALRVLL